MRNDDARGRQPVLEHPRNGVLVVSLLRSQWFSRLRWGTEHLPFAGLARRPDQEQVATASMASTAWNL